VTRRLLVCADGGPAVGLGHLARAGGLIAAARLAGWEVRLLTCAAPGLATRLVGAVDLLSCADAAPARRAALVAAAVAADVVAVDGAAWRQVWSEAGVDAACQLVIFDDLGLDVPAGSIVVNGNLGAETWAGRYPGAHRHLLGRGFQVVRPALTAAGRGGAPLAPVARRLVVTMGGSDPVGATAHVVAALPALPVAVDVVIGPGFADHAALAAAVVHARAGLADLRVWTDPPDLLTRLGQADLVLSAAGGTLAELAYLGRPTMAWAIVADQRDNAAAHAAAGLIAGGEELADVAPVALGVAIAALVGDASRRHQLAHALGASVDGAGAARILAAL
jgi:UDP-2,4-diacetamido-2,4,6-trideoxy-beta-L-altropyranose hydrolase